jgi:hypothetical protein
MQIMQYITLGVNVATAIVLVLIVKELKGK